jgi:NAD(P)-dependent dehydrogenase (short-subunit alcohol dehydrogenase family)
MESDVNDKVVAITGGFGILGIATAEWLSARGAHVALIGRGAAPAAETLPVILGDAKLLGGVDLVDAQA